MLECVCWPYYNVLIERWHCSTNHCGLLIQTGLFHLFFHSLIQLMIKWNSYRDSLCHHDNILETHFTLTCFYWFCKWILLLSWAELVLKTPYWVLLWTKFIIRFRGLCYCGKQQEPFNPVTQLVSTCRTEQYFRLEALLACIRGRLGFKYISLPVWRWGTDCNNNQ